MKDKYTSLKKTVINSVRRICSPSERLRVWGGGVEQACRAHLLVAGHVLGFVGGDVQGDLLVDAVPHLREVRGLLVRHEEVRVLRIVLGVGTEGWGTRGINGENERELIYSIHQIKI